MNLESVNQRPMERRNDEFFGEVPVKLGKEELRELSKLNPWRAAVHIVGEWLAVAAAIWLCQSHWNPLLYIVTVAFIGARQHGLLILMHDGVHYRLFPNRRFNDWVSE